MQQINIKSFLNEHLEKIPKMNYYKIEYQLSSKIDNKLSISLSPKNIRDIILNKVYQQISTQSKKSSNNLTI